MAIWEEVKRKRERDKSTFLHTSRFPRLLLIIIRLIINMYMGKYIWKLKATLFVPFSLFNFISTPTPFLSIFLSQSSEKNEREPNIISQIWTCFELFVEYERRKRKFFCFGLFLIFLFSRCSRYTYDIINNYFWSRKEKTSYIYICVYLRK